MKNDTTYAGVDAHKKNLFVAIGTIAVPNPKNLRWSFEMTR